MPLNYVDGDGKIGYYFYDPDMFCGEETDIDIIVENDLVSLEKQYQTEIVPIAMDVDNPDNNYTTFQDAWNSMGENGEKIDVVVIFTHANGNWFVAESSVSVSVVDGKETYTRGTTASINRNDIEQLDDKEIGTLYLFGCNMGLTNPPGDSNSLASTFYKEDSRKSIGMIIASDGNITHGYLEGKRTLYARPNKDYHPDGNFDGFKKYEMVDGELVVTKIEDISVYWGEISPERYCPEEDCMGGKEIEKGKGKKKK